MSRKLAVLRPEPGNAATAARIEAVRLVPIRLPLFRVVPIAWKVPDPEAHDALLITSANAIRHAGPGLDALKRLPVFAVGAASAGAARAAGLHVVVTGERDAAALIEEAEAQGVTRALHLGGRERSIVPGGPIAAAVAAYANEPVDPGAEAIAALENNVVLLHSGRAAEHLTRLCARYHVDRRRIALAAISPPVLASAGRGWGIVAAARTPSDAGLIATAATLAD